MPGPGSSDPLSRREGEIAIAYATGQSYKEIARSLGIAPATVRAHLRTIYRKTGVSSKLELASVIDTAPQQGVRQLTISANSGLPQQCLVVLPFARLDTEVDNDFLPRGLTEDVATELSRFHQFKVLSPGTARRLHDVVGAVGEAATLGLNYIVDGSIRRHGGAVRITARLIDVQGEIQLWAEHFDRPSEEFFAVTDEIVRRIAGTIAGRIDAAGTERSRRKPPSSLDAYECVLRGTALGFGDPVAETQAGQFFERAIELDPEYVLAYSKLAHIHCLAWFREQTDDTTTLDRAFDLAKRAVALDPEEPNAHFVLGWVHLFRRSFELAEGYYRRALELNPNSAEHTFHMGSLHSFLGNADLAFQWFERSRRIDSFFDPTQYWRMQGIAYFTADRLREAIDNLRRSPVIPFWAWVYLAAAYALIDDEAHVAECRKEILKAAPAFSLVRFSAKEPLRRPEDRERLLIGMRKAGLPE